MHQRLEVDFSRPIPYLSHWLSKHLIAAEMAEASCRQQQLLPLDSCVVDPSRMDSNVIRTLSPKLRQMPFPKGLSRWAGCC